MWKKTYKPEAASDEKVYSEFASIVFTNDKGGFVAAGEFRETLNKIGFGKASIWLAQCDDTGSIVSDVTFSGRSPSIHTIQKERLAVMYDAGSALSLDCRVRAVDMELKEQWEKKAGYISLWVDRPAICSIPSNQGIVLAGANHVTKDKGEQINCRLFQNNTDGQPISAALIPITQKAFLFTRVVCMPDRAYVAIQTKGMTPYDAKEASIFEIRLKTK